jgi:hypothetical protein
VAESPETQLGTPGCVWADEDSEQDREAAGSGSGFTLEGEVGGLSEEKLTRPEDGPAGCKGRFGSQGRERERGRER